MDPAMIATAVIAVVRPFLRGLLSKGEDVLEDAGEKTAEGAKKLAQRMWQRLTPKLQERPAGTEAAEALAADPDNEDAAGALRLQVKTVLKGDAPLAEELARMVEEGIQAGVVADVVIYGGQKADRGGVNVGRDAGNINTGSWRDN